MTPRPRLIHDTMKGIQSLLNTLHYNWKKLCCIADNTATLVTNLDVYLSSQDRTPGILRATGAGSITGLVYDFSVSNVGTANGTLLGQTLKPGETVNFNGGAINNYYPAGTVTYDATGTEFLIIYNS